MTSSQPFLTSAIVSGVVGTVAMIGVIYVCPLVRRAPPLNIPLFVGTIFSSRPGVATVLGTGLLLFNGSVIACVGRLVWHFGAGAQGLLEGLGFGAILGLLSLGIMKIMLRAHPQAVEMRPVSQLLVGFSLVVGHLAYGVCVALVLGPR